MKILMKILWFIFYLLSLFSCALPLPFHLHLAQLSVISCIVFAVDVRAISIMQKASALSGTETPERRASNCRLGISACPRPWKEL